MPKGERLLVLATTAAGVVLALAVTLLQSSVYRADASIVLVRQGQPPGSDPSLAAAAAAAAALFHTRAVAASAAENLGLEESGSELLERVDVESEPRSSLVRLTVEGASRDEARRVAQELTEVSTVLFNDRFGPETTASIWEAPQAEEGRISPEPARNLALGALFGALAGWVLAVRRRLPPKPEAPRPAVPRPAPPQAPRQVTEARREPTPAAAAVPAALPAAAPPPPSAPAPAVGPFVPPRVGDWTLADVERLLAEHGPAFPDRADELSVYLASFREVAEPDGRLPGGVEAVMEDVFRDLIERARTSAPRT
jgi:capsular polysaccharide biosynthesis protein